jgi:hypothetical protein
MRLNVEKGRTGAAREVDRMDVAGVTTLRRHFGAANEFVGLPQGEA